MFNNGKSEETWLGSVRREAREEVISSGFSISRWRFCRDSKDILIGGQWMEGIYQGWGNVADERLSYHQYQAQGSRSPLIGGFG